MKLRDGKLYTPRGEHHMVLRDGKASTPQDGITSPRKSQRYSLGHVDKSQGDQEKWSSLTSEGKARRAAPKGSETRQQSTSRARPMISAARDGTAKKDVDVESKSTRLSKSMAGESELCTMKTNRRRTTEAVTSHRLSSSTHRRVTSTPAVQNAPVESPMEALDFSALSLPRPNLNNISPWSVNQDVTWQQRMTDVSVDRSVVSQESVSVVTGSRSRRKAHSRTHQSDASSSGVLSSRRSNVKKSWSGAGIDSANGHYLHEHAFADLSKSSLSSVLKDDHTHLGSLLSPQGDGVDDSWDGGSDTLFSCDDSELDIIQHMNHGKWSHFHDKRRDWYLNRWRRVPRRQHMLIYRVCHTIITTFISIITTIIFLGSKHPNRSFSRLKHMLYRTTERWITVCRRVIMKIFVWNSEVHYIQTCTEDEGSVVVIKEDRCRKCCGMLCCFGFLFALLLVSILLFGILWKGNNHFAQTSLAGVKGVAFVDTGNGLFSVPAWHILAAASYGLPSAEAIKDGSPAVLFIQHGGENGLRDKMNYFGNLSSLGYHVIAPVYPERDDAVLMTWSWIKSHSRSTIVYLWGDYITVKEAESVSKRLCQHGFPPSGVLIAVSPIDPHVKTRSIEVWSCNCTSDHHHDSNGMYHHYPNVKCPVTDASLYSDIVNCLSSLRS